MILIISLAISIQTMIVAPTGKTTKPNDASMSSICFILFSFLAKCIEVLALGWASQSIHLVFKTVASHLVRLTKCAKL